MVRVVMMTGRVVTATDEVVTETVHGVGSTVMRCEAGDRDAMTRAPDSGAPDVTTREDRASTMTGS